MKQITVEDIIALRPRVDELEDVYRIKIEDGFCYLEVYENSDFGLEYNLYDSNYGEIDGGVIDDYEAEDENAVACVIFSLLKEMNVKGINIEKLPHEECDEETVDVFHDRIQRAWEEKVARLKRKKVKLDGLDLDNMSREDLLSFAKAHLSKCIESPKGYNFTEGFYYHVEQSHEGLSVYDNDNKYLLVGSHSEMNKYFEKAY